MIPTCSTCADMRYVSWGWASGEPAACTCGAGDPADELVFHELTCNAVPCPFCQLVTDVPLRLLDGVFAS